MEETFSVAVGKRVKSWRGFRRKKQYEVAAAIGMQRTQYSQFEAGRQELIRLDQLSALAQYLGTTTDYLLLLSEEPDPQKPSRPSPSPGEAFCPASKSTPRPVTLLVCLESARREYTCK